MGFKCTICRSDKRGEIERSMAAGDSDATIAKEFNLHAGSVSTHRANHTKLSAARMDPDTLAGYQRELQQFQLGHKVQRLSKLQALFDRVEAVILTRARNAEELLEKVARMEAAGEVVPKGYAPYPGAESGLLTKDGAFDTYLAREYRSCLEQAAKELGEWDVTGAGSRDAGTGSQVTIFQSVRGELQQAIGQADARPGAKPRGLPAPVEAEVLDAD